MTLDQWADKVDHSDKELIRGAVLILSALRSINAERIEFLLAQVRLSKGLMPKQLWPGIESLEADFSLIIAFAEMSKQYDRSEGADQSTKWLDELFKPDGTKTS